MSFSMVCATMILFKFMFLCVWKKMKVMNDDLIARIVIIISIFVSFALFMAKFLGPGKPVYNTIICTGTYLPSYENLGKRFTPEPFVLFAAFITYICLIIPITLKRRQNEAFDQQHGSSIIAKRNNLPKSLESLVWNLVIISNMTCAIVVAELLNRYKRLRTKYIVCTLYILYTYVCAM